MNGELSEPIENYSSSSPPEVEDLVHCANNAPVKPRFNLRRKSEKIESFASKLVSSLIDGIVHKMSIMHSEPFSPEMPGKRLSVVGNLHRPNRNQSRVSIDKIRFKAEPHDAFFVASGLLSKTILTQIIPLNLLIATAMPCSAIGIIDRTENTILTVTFRAFPKWSDGERSPAVL